ncbi:hypothetical protein ROHU_000181 [Labeo rohita]|uniref:Uncharacterized protein n=1 Tax=Labeo rohita TaxID=84645 RepID=A0A498P5W7_LABRO|nr:hypothetical protein ROHU_000181 [Labeo rohita]
MDIDSAGVESGRVGFCACEIDDGDGPKFLYAAGNERVIEMRLGKSRIVNLYENARGAEEFGRFSFDSLTMDAKLQINPSDTDDDLFGSKSPPPKKSSRQSAHSQSSRSQSSKRLRSTVQIPQPREHSRTSSLSETSPTSSRSHVHSPPHTRTWVRHRHRSHRHKSRRDRSPRQQSQYPSTASPRQRTHGKSPRPESNIKQWTVGAPPARSQG